MCSIAKKHLDIGSNPAFLELRQTFKGITDSVPKNARLGQKLLNQELFSSLCGIIYMAKGQFGLFFNNDCPSSQNSSWT